MTSSSAGREFLRRYATWLVLIAILVIYGFEAHTRRERMSTPASVGDQGAYLSYARYMYESNYAVIGQRNRMPAFPFLLSLIYRPGLTETEFLRRAQAFNVNLSILLLFLLFFIFRRFFAATHSLALVAATAFGVFLYRATNAQTEVLYYFIGFCAFLLLLRMLVTPGWWLAAVAGATLGVAQLTKASALPALGIWGAFFVCRTVLESRANRERRWTISWARLGQLLIVVGMFIAVLAPYLRTNKQVFDRYFYNESSTFVMWCDSWPEASEFLEAYGPKGKWRSLPPDQIPSASKFWREHSVGQISGRLLVGMSDLVRLKLQVIGYYKFVAFILIVAGVLAIRQRRKLPSVIARAPFAAVFCLLYFLAYFILYSWYGAIVKDSRFILSIFLPVAFAGSLFVRALANDRAVMIGQRQIPIMFLFSAVLGALAVVDVCYNAVLT